MFMRIDAHHHVWDKHRREHSGETIAVLEETPELLQLAYVDPTSRASLAGSN
jgi:hypothetical protein